MTSTKEDSEASNNQQQQQKTGADDNDDDDDDLASVHLMLEPHLRPAPPDLNSDLSKQVFDEHKQLAKEYLKVHLKFRCFLYKFQLKHFVSLFSFSFSFEQIHTEIAYVTKHRDEILSKMDPRERKERLELCNKVMEKEELLKFQANLKRQLELIRMNSRPPMPPPAMPAPTINLQPPPPPPAGTSMPMSMSSPGSMTMTTPSPSAPPYDRQNSNSSTSGNDDGWVLVPSQTESDA